MIEIDGTCDEKFGVLRPLLADLIDRGEDVGASISLAIDGKPLVDIWGGWADELRQCLGSATPSRTSGRQQRR